MIAVASPLKWHGGKHYLASKIVALMPRHTHYVEPFAGGLSVLFAKDPEGVSEVANDVFGHLTNFWRCLAHPPTFDEVRRRLEALPVCEAVWREAHCKLAKPCDQPGCICMACAMAFFLVCRQSLAGRMESFAPLSRTRTRRGMNEQASAWLGAVEGLPEVHARLKRVVVLNRDALDVIRQQDGPDTLYYLDPPYDPGSRASPNVYAHEMSHDDHARLLVMLAGIKGRFLLSGYRCELYDRAAIDNNWRRVDFDLPNNSAGGATKRRMTECVWLNYDPPAAN